MFRSGVLLLFLLACCAAMLFACGPTQEKPAPPGLMSTTNAAGAPDTPPPPIPSRPPATAAGVSTPDLQATVSAMVAAEIATQTPSLNTPAAGASEIAPTPTALPDIPATVSAALTRVAPTPPAAPAYPGPTIAEVVAAIEDGLVQIITPTGSGSGFVVDEDGLIITNAHLVAEHSQVTIRFANDDHLTAQVAGYDQHSDLAALRPDAAAGRRFHPIPMAEPDSISVGDTVIALGFPLGDELGRDYTVTAGIVSALRREGGVDRIQTDAAINPGNSGGPLLNRAGRLVGVNAETYATYHGISFAIGLAAVRANLPFLASGGIATAENRGPHDDWWTYESRECRYTLRVPPGWELTGIGDDCNAKFEQRNENGAICTASVSMYDLEMGESLSDFAQWYKDTLVAMARSWETFELSYFGRGMNDPGGYEVGYLWRDNDQHCLTSETDRIYLSSHRPGALVLNIGVCSSVSEELRDEILAMRLTY